MISHIMAVVLLGSSYTWVVADDAVLQAPVLAGIFTRCAGLYDMAAMIQQSKGRDVDAQVMTDHGNGAEKAAAVLLMASGTPEDQAEVMADEQRRSQAMYHIAFLQAGNGNALVKGFARCTNDYMPIQKAVLSALRAYAEQGKEDQALLSRMIIEAIDGRGDQTGSPSP
jgi:hypothetical protein